MRRGLIAALLTFQAGWLVAALGAAAGHPLLAAAGPLGSAALTLAVLDQRRQAIAAMLAGGLIGLGGESLLMWLGLVAFAAPGPLAGLAPAWIVALWIAFAPLSGATLTWLAWRPGLAAGFGALLAPPTYLAGAALGALALSEPRWVSLLSIGVLWALAMPLLARIGAPPPVAGDRP